LHPASVLPTRPTEREHTPHASLVVNPAPTTARARLAFLDVLHRRPFVERLPDAQVEIQLQTSLLRVKLVGELDLKRLGIHLDDRTLASLEKVAQVVSKLGVAEPQSHPQKALPYVPWPQWPTLTVAGNDALSNSHDAADVERRDDRLSPRPLGRSPSSRRIGAQLPKFQRAGRLDPSPIRWFTIALDRKGDAQSDPMAESELYRSACWPQTRADEMKEAEAATASFAFNDPKCHLRARRALQSAAKPRAMRRGPCPLGSGDLERFPVPRSARPLTQAERNLPTSRSACAA
jgi:hypothetical protein